MSEVYVVTQASSATFSFDQTVFSDKESAKKQFEKDYAMAKKILPHGMCKEESTKTESAYVVASEYADYIYGEIKMFNV